MTATITAPDTAALWDDTWNLPSRRLVVLWDREQTASGTIARSLYAPDWKHEVVDGLVELIDTAVTLPNVDALKRLIRLINGLPADLSVPFVAIGEGGAMVLEWDIQGFELHITLDEDCDEVYLRTPDGDEWEGTLSAGAGRLMDVVRRLAALA